MEKQNTEVPLSYDKDKVYVIHCKVIGGSHADIYEIGKALKEFKKNVPFRLEAFVTDDKVDLRCVDTLIEELRTLQKIERKKKDANLPNL